MIDRSRDRLRFDYVIRAYWGVLPEYNGMRMVMVSIYDQAVGAYMRPWFVRSDGEGIRMFLDECGKQSEDNPMVKHPEQYSLWGIGHFFDDTGKFVMLEHGPVELVRGSQVK